jgi:hypothetical protein
MNIQNSKSKTQINSKAQNPKLGFGLWDLIGYWKLVLGICTVFLLIPSFSHAALLYSQTANQVVALNQTFTVNWLLDTQGQAINSVDLTLHFTPNTLQAVEAEAGSSGLDLWITPPEFDNAAGTIKMIGGVAGGVTDSKFPLFTTTFKAAAAGSAKITLDGSSIVLLADGAGTKMQLSFAQLNFPVVAQTAPELVSSSSHPDPEQWSQDNNVQVQVQPQAGVDYSYSFSSNTEVFPDDQADDVSGPLAFDNLPDGVYYFKLNSKQGSGAWSEAAVRKFMIDRSPPESFTPVVATDPSVFGGAPFVSFNTTDQVSGVSKYEVKAGVLGAWIETDQTYYVLPKLRLTDSVQVRAVDAAGNQTGIRTVTVGGRGHNFVKWLLWLIILGVLAVLIWLIRKVHRKLQIPRNPNEK